MIGLYGGIDIVIDEMSRAGNGEIVIWAYVFFDVNVKHAQTFGKLTGI